MGHWLSDRFLGLPEASAEKNPVVGRAGSDALNQPARRARVWICLFLFACEFANARFKNVIETLGVLCQNSKRTIGIGIFTCRRRNLVATTSVVWRFADGFQRSPFRGSDHTRPLGYWNMRSEPHNLWEDGILQKLQYFKKTPTGRRKKLLKKFRWITVKAGRFDLKNPQA